MKKFAIAAGVVLILVAVAVFYVGSNLDSIVKSAIQKYGSEALGVTVSVGSVELQLTEGRGTIRNLQVANPSGYSRGNAISFGELTLDIDYASQVIELVRAGAPEINIEAKGADNNIDALLSNLESDASTEGADEGEEPLSLRIERIEIEAARAAMTSDLLEKPVEIGIDALVLQNLEGTPDEIASQILKKLLGRIGDAVKGAAKAAAKEKVEEKKEELLEEAKESLLKKLRDRD